MTTRPHQNLELIRRVLSDDYLELALKRLTIDERADETTSVTLEAVDTHAAIHEVAGRGHGVVDAIFQGLLERYGKEYHSLETIELSSFRAEALMDTKQHRSGGDAMGRVTVEVKNSEGVTFSFSDESRSITLSSARATLAVAEYFINAERAFITLYRSRQDAQERHRADLVTRYTREMAEVVKSTSYAEVIEKIKRELD